LNRSERVQGDQVHSRCSDRDARPARQCGSAQWPAAPSDIAGGLLALGSGLALGREGPTVQMGAALGWLISHRLINDDQDKEFIGAAGAGAGLAVVFNAPLGGSIFVFEELTGSITPWLLVATLTAALVGVWIMRLMSGNGLDFAVRQVSFIEAWRIGPFLALGALLGAVGALYNVTVVGLLHFADRLDRFPHLSSTNRAARFLLGPWSYAAGAPGGALCAALSTWRFIGWAFRRSRESFHSAAGTLAHRLCGGRDGGNVFGQRACAPDRNCAYH